ncbi:hypothetical protein P154DRAFT_518496 [Amniculicola lignicola CBS 123094]|uniref:F-box domain-containing protein n=1 Tax=Amniculicola lignicola CBS 123094 TaxID=1392246 RepID=A0A6A5WUT8_9PLEO|nr:hypothetical protein P154DRAFT_518496 [Amniculicola lignicola CBS 123094]
MFHKRSPPRSTDRDSFGDFQNMRPADYARGQVPWCLQPHPVSPSPASRSLLAWRLSVAALISSRIAPYSGFPKLQNTAAQQVACPTRPLSPVATELVENILHSVDFVTLLVATGVSRKWGDIASFVMQRRGLLDTFQHEPALSPVQFHDAIPEALTRAPIPREEIAKVDAEFFEHVNGTREKIRFGQLHVKDVDMPDIVKKLYLDGRFTQRPTINLVQRSEIIAYVDHHYRQLLWSDILTPRLPYLIRCEFMLTYLDLSQFNFNPLFTRLFENHIAMIGGMVEIALPPGLLSPDTAAWHNLPDTAMDYLDDYLTQPPIISLNISTWIPLLEESKPRPRKPLHIFNVKDKAGIRIKELVEAMKAAYLLAIEHWIYWAKQLCIAVNNVHWDQDIWVVENAPKLLLTLDPFAGGKDAAMSTYYLSCI